MTSSVSIFRYLNPGIPSVRVRLLSACPQQGLSSQRKDLELAITQMGRFVPQTTGRMDAGRGIHPTYWRTNPRIRNFADYLVSLESEFGGGRADRKSQRQISTFFSPSFLLIMRNSSCCCERAGISLFLLDPSPLLSDDSRLHDSILQQVFPRLRPSYSAIFLQGGPSGRGQAFVDNEMRVAL